MYGTSSNIPIHIRFASDGRRVVEVSDVTSVNTVLQQCTGKAVRLNIQFEITCSTALVEFNTTMALVVLRSDAISSVRALRQNERDISLSSLIGEGVPHLYCLSERRGLLVRIS